MQLKNEILNELEPLFKEANAKKLFFKMTWGNEIFSPKELKEYHKNDRFIFGKDNWILIDPKEKINKLKNEIIEKENEIISIENKIKEGFECN